jgi:UDP-glucuronate decarboxylase
MEPLQVDADEIYNLACPAAPINYDSDPVGVLKTIIQGAINMLEIARRTNARILQASTGEVYGHPTVHPQSESYWGHVNPVGPRSCYDEGKRAAESLFFAYHRQHGVRIKIARIFLTYGPGMRRNDGRAISNFIPQALANQPITIYGSGTQSRSGTYVDDMVDGLLRLMAAPDELTGPVNLGSSTEITIGALAHLIVELTRSRSEVIFLPSLVDDPHQRTGDFTLARTALGWTPKVELREGLLRTADYFRSIT